MFHVKHFVYFIVCTVRFLIACEYETYRTSILPYIIPNVKKKPTYLYIIKIIFPYSCLSYTFSRCLLEKTFAIT